MKHTVLAAASIGLINLCASAQNSIQELAASTLPVVQPTAMSADTTAVVGYAAGNAYFLNVQAGSWSPMGAATGIPHCSSNGSYASSETTPASGLTTASRWSIFTNSWTALPTLGSSSGSSASSASDISGDGNTIVGLGWISAGEAHAFKWTQAGGTVDLDLTGGTSSRAIAVSRDGTTTVGWDRTNAGTNRGIVWKNGMATYTGSLEPTQPVFGPSECHGVSNDGQYVVGTSNSRAFLWTATGGLVDLGQGVSGVKATPLAVSDDGSTIVGWAGTSTLFQRAIIYRPEFGTQMVELLPLLQSLNVPGASNWSTMWMAFDVSPDGASIGGWGVYASTGQIQGFIVHLPRVPSPYCTSSTSTHGCVAAITGDMNPTTTHSTPCNIQVSNVEGQRAGIIFYGLSPVATTWCSQGGGTSYLCVKSPSTRTGVQNSGGTAGSCNGTLSLDWSAFQLAHPSALGNPWVAGTNVFVQGWFRDPLACKTTNLSNGLQLTYQP